MARTGADTEARYAGFWRRLAAHLIDALILAALVALGSKLGLVSATVTVAEGDATLEFGGGPLLLAAAYTLGFWATLQATPGKLAAGVRIVDADTGSKPGLRQLVGRYLAYYVSAIPCFLGFLWIAVDARKQGWHDKLADTAVVRGRRDGGRAPLRDPAGLDLAGSPVGSP
jgi:uncharacterized RDD family membrane protein YckC